MIIVYYPLLLMIIYLSWKKYKDLLNPIFINGIIWFGFPLLYEIIRLTNSNYRNLTYKFYLFVFLYCVIFTFFTSLFIRNADRKYVVERFEKLNIPVVAIDRFVLFCIVVNLILILRLFFLSGTFNLISSISIIRVQVVKQVDFFTFDMKLLIFLFNFTPLLLCYIFLYGVKVKKWIILLIAEMFLISLLFATKGRILRYFIVIIIIFYYSSIKRKKITVAMTLIVAFVSVFIFTIIRDSSFFSKNSALDYLFLYVLSPMPAFDRLLNGELSYFTGGFGAQSLVFFYRFFAKIFGTVVPPYSYPGFIEIPLSSGHIQTNVFTLLGPYFMDFGFWGSAVCAAIYAFIFGYAYKKMVIDYNKAFSIFFVFNIPYLLMQFFGDFIMPTLSITIQEFICALIIVNLCDYKGFCDRYGKVKLVTRVSDFITSYRRKVK